MSTRFFFVYSLELCEEVWLNPGMTKSLGMVYSVEKIENTDFFKLFRHINYPKLTVLDPDRLNPSLSNAV